MQLDTFIIYFLFICLFFKFSTILPEITPAQKNLNYKRYYWIYGLQFSKNCSVQSNG